MGNMRENPNMMFTLDEEDEETEYGESFKSNPAIGKINQCKKIHDSDEDEDDEDIAPDDSQRYRAQRALSDFQDEGIIYTKIAKEEEKKRGYPI